MLTGESLQADKLFVKLSDVIDFETAGLSVCWYEDGGRLASGTVIYDEGTFDVEVPGQILIYNQSTACGFWRNRADVYVSFDERQTRTSALLAVADALHMAPATAGYTWCRNHKAVRSWTISNGQFIEELTVLHKDSPRTLITLTSKSVPTFRDLDVTSDAKTRDDIYECDILALIATLKALKTDTLDVLQTTY